MVQIITAANSKHVTSGTAFSATGPDTLIVDANAFIISEDGVGASLSGFTSVTINGEVGSYHDGNPGIGISAASSDGLQITVGSTGHLFGAARGLVFLSTSTLVVVNRGSIVSDDFAINCIGKMALTNSGTIIGKVKSSDSADTFTDFRKVGHHAIKSGNVIGTIDLGAGDDHFNGGAHSETVRDAVGADTYNFGVGNDIYVAVREAVGTTDFDIDIVNGGSGVDTYDASAATRTVTISLGNFIDSPNAQGLDVGFDAITGFENAIGGSGNDVLTGSNGANTLIGGAGLDYLIGAGGRDILTGGNGPDHFVFGKLSDSGVTARTRDVITDFNPNEDVIDLSFMTPTARRRQLIRSTSPAPTASKDLPITQANYGKALVVATPLYQAM